VQKILIVDDSRLIVEMVKDALEAKQYEVCTAGDGKEGITKVKSESPDLILLDMHMPNMTGYEFMRALRAEALITGGELPCVIMFTAEEKMEEAFKIEGVKGYIVKPTPMDVLTQKIEECLNSCS